MSNEPLGQHNPFGEVNPYAAPPPMLGGIYRTRDEFLRDLKIPAIVLLVLASLTMLYRIGDSFYTVYVLSAAEQTRLPPGLVVGVVIGAVVTLFLNTVVVLGSLAMLWGRSLALARAAAIVSLIPFCAPGLVLGIPFGIWATVILFRTGAREAFSQ